MNTFSVVIFVLAGIIATAEAQGDSLRCPQICPLIFKPTCATDGNGSYKHFSNSCNLRVFNCNRQRSSLATYEVTNLDWCTTKEVKEFDSDYARELETADSTCLRPCPLNLAPVCGSNGINRMSFSNECDMETYNCISKTKNRNPWKLLKKGPCSE